MERMREALVRGQIPVLIAEVKSALGNGVAAREILENGLLEGMNRVGEGFASGKLFIPEVMLAARAMQAGVDLIRDGLLSDGVERTAECIVLATVQGDQHDIGKNLVRIMLEGSGFDVVDLGTNVPAQKIVSVAKEKGARLIALSALLTTTMPQMEAVTKLAHAEGISVMVGGAPVTQTFADKIGADGYAKDAATAASLAAKLLG